MSELSTTLCQVRQPVSNCHGNRLCPRSHIQFGEDALHMESYRALADAHNLCDFPISFSVLHPIENRNFPRREFAYALVGRARSF